MQDILQDIVSHTHSLGFITTLKVNAEADTKIESMADDRSVIMSATTHSPVGEFTGIFGMPDLGKLSYHLKNPEYKENAKIEVVQEERNGEVMPTHIHFENKTGDFENDYRFMNKAIIEEKLKSVTFQGKGWDVELQPSMASIARMKLMSGAHAEETVFQVKTENNMLNFYFGDEATHAGSFTFAHDIEGTLTHTWAWPVAQTIAILNLDGDKKMSITDQGAMMISVDSGMAKYDYILPAQQK
tara:strand:+ start:3436 stop:4164 length:729 start_codon:yes stop_codon:yes gene_type:complete